MKTSSQKGKIRQKIMSFLKKDYKIQYREQIFDSYLIKKKIQTEIIKKKNQKFHLGNEIVDYVSSYCQRSKKRKEVKFVEQHKNDGMFLSIFVDESSFQLFCFPNQTYSLKGSRKIRMKPKDPEKLNVRGVFSINFKRNLLISQENMNGELFRSIFKKYLFKFIKSNFKGKIPQFYLDRDPKHIAKKTLELLNNQISIRTKIRFIEAFKIINDYQIFMTKFELPKKEDLTNLGPINISTLKIITNGKKNISHKQQNLFVNKPPQQSI
ncbi:hypothetical protein ABPG72_000442 [Tetrahymena utriculariae]